MTAFNVNEPRDIVPTPLFPMLAAMYCVPTFWLLLWLYISAFAENRTCANIDAMPIVRQIRNEINFFIYFKFSKNSSETFAGAVFIIHENHIAYLILFGSYLGTMRTLAPAL